MTNHLVILSCGAVYHVVQRRSVNSWVRVSPFFKKEVFYWCQCFCWWYFNRLLQMMNRTINLVILNVTIQSPDSKRKFFPFKLFSYPSDRSLLQRNSKILPHCERKRQNTWKKLDKRYQTYWRDFVTKANIVRYWACFGRLIFKSRE